MTARQDIQHIDASLRWVRVASALISVPVHLYVLSWNRGERICGGCMQSLPRNSTHFGTCSKSIGGLRSKCRVCIAKVKYNHYYRTRPQQRARQLVYQRANRSKLYAYNAAWQRRRNATLRAELIAAYGGKCACCGEAESTFLDLDHVHNNGNAHRREVGNNTVIMLRLREQGWPAGDFQLLCCNCNQGKARNGGVCPHQQ